MTRIRGSNKHGTNNEDILVSELNNHTYATLNSNLKEFINYIAKDKGIKVTKNTKIGAEKETSNRLKQDVYLYIETNKAYISLKIGSGNSVHQEKCMDFITYIKDVLHASEKICEDFQLLLWADGTTDGTGSTTKDSSGVIICRFTTGEFKKKYPVEFAELQEFLDNNVEVLIDRFLLTGRHHGKVDYFYHGSATNGFWTSAKEVIHLNVNEHRRNKRNLHVGRLTLQAWNASTKGNNEKKRGTLQVKYAGMQDDLFKLMKAHATNMSTFFGDKEEFDIVARFNRNKTSPLWRPLVKGLGELDDVYMVRATERVVSHLSEKKVLPKTDAYLVRCSLEREFLLAREFSLTEKDLKDKKYKKIRNTGISVKRDGSRSYTIQKLTFESFVKVFSDIFEEPEFIFWGILLYSNEKEKDKNFEMMKLLVLEEDKVTEYYIDNLGKDLKLDDIGDITSIHKWALEQLKDSIKNNYNIYESLFTGQGWFDEPYVAHYIYTNRNLLENVPTNFSITTGSGRTKGKLSVEIKPAK